MIDNDIDLIEKSFGFETAFSIANDVISFANNEAEGAYNGIAPAEINGARFRFYCCLSYTHLSTERSFVFSCVNKHNHFLDGLFLPLIY